MPSVRSSAELFMHILSTGYVVEGGRNFDRLYNRSLSRDREAYESSCQAVWDTVEEGAELGRVFLHDIVVGFPAVRIVKSGRRDNIDHILTLAERAARDRGLDDISNSTRRAEIANRYRVEVSGTLSSRSEPYITTPNASDNAVPLTAMFPRWLSHPDFYVSLRVDVSPAAITLTALSETSTNPSAVILSREIAGKNAHNAHAFCQWVGHESAYFRGAFREAISKYNFMEFKAPLAGINLHPALYDYKAEVVNFLYDAIEAVLAGGDFAFVPSNKYTNGVVTSLLPSIASDKKLYKRTAPAPSSVFAYVHKNSPRLTRTTAVKRTKIQPTLQTMLPNLKHDIREVRNAIRRHSASSDTHSLYKSQVDSLMMYGYSSKRCATLLSPSRIVVECSLLKEYYPIEMTAKDTITNRYYCIAYVANLPRDMVTFTSKSKITFNPAFKSTDEVEIMHHRHDPLKYLHIKWGTYTKAPDKFTLDSFPFLGVELEVVRADQENRPSVIQGIYELLGRDFIVTKHDGSLEGYRPFEIVSAPAVLQVHQERWKPFLESSHKRHLKSYTTERCGLHVHVNKACFTGLHLAKFIRFFNSVDNYKFNTLVAQRKENKYTKYKPTSKMQETVSLMTPQRRTDEARRVAVNCTNKNTVEVRIFKGNLSYKGFMKSLEFTDAVWHYTKQCSVSELSYKDFLLWLFSPDSANRDYNILRSWLVAHGIHVTNNIIKSNTPADEALRALEKRKCIKQAQNYVNKHKKFAKSELLTVNE